MAAAEGVRVVIVGAGHPNQGEHGEVTRMVRAGSAAMVLLDGSDTDRAVPVLDLIDEQAGPPSLKVLAVAGDDRESNVRVTFETDRSCTFVAALDDDPMLPVTPPVMLAGLSPGEHTFRAQATDLAGNVSAAAEASWETIAPDETAPTVGFLETPVPKSTTGTARFTVAASEPSSFETRLDGGQWNSRPSSADGMTTVVTLLITTPGLHVLEARATDKAGNTSTPVSFQWEHVRPEAATDPPVLTVEKDGVTVAWDQLATVTSWKIATSTQARGVTGRQTAYEVQTIRPDSVGVIRWKFPVAYAPRYVGVQSNVAGAEWALKEVELAATPAPAPGPIPSPSGRVQQIGVTGIEWVAWSGLDYAVAKRELGINAERPSVYPVEQNSATIDRALAKGAAQGIYLTLCVGVNNQEMRNIDRPTIARYMADAVSRYGEGSPWLAQNGLEDFYIEFHEVMNEPYGSWFWGSADPAAYARIARDCLTAARAANPRAKIMVAFRQDVMSWGDQVLAADPNLLRDADGYVLHLYGEPYGGGYGHNWAGLLDDFNRWATQKAGRQLPVVITECNRHDHLPSNEWGNEDAWIRNMPEYVKVIRERPWVRAAHFFPLRGYGSRPGNFDCLGFWDSAGVQRPARCRALRDALAANPPTS